MLNILSIGLLKDKLNPFQLYVTSVRSRPHMLEVLCALHITNVLLPAFKVQISVFVSIAVETLVTECPRTDPGVQFSRTGLFIVYFHYFRTRRINKQQTVFSVLAL